MQVKCPQCGKAVQYSLENKHRPFCSERCRTLDLGAWADERYRVPLSHGNSDENSSVNENPNGHEPSDHLFPKPMLN